MNSLPCRRPAHSRGYTLIELVIALGIGVAILLALMLMFSSNSGNQQELERTLRQIENARFAVDTLAEDAMHAGYFSDFNPNRADPPAVYTSPDPCAIPTNAQGWVQPDAALGTAVQLPRPVQGIAAATVVDCLQLESRRAGTEALVIRRAETGPPIDFATAALRPNNIYIQTSRCRNEWTQVRLASGAEPAKSFTLLGTDCDAGKPNNALRRLLQRTYFVATCNDCRNGGDGIPTLKRIEMVDGVDGARLRTTAIAEGVENLQFEFGVDTNEDGSPDVSLLTTALNANELTWQGKPETDLRVAPIWRNVVSVRMHVLTRSTQPSPGFVETRTYQLGPDVKLEATGLVDGFKRTLLSTTTRVNNVGSRRE